MPQFFMFECKTCKLVIKGPQVAPNDTNNPRVGQEFGAGKVPGVVCKANPWHKQFLFTGRQELPPTAPPIPGPKAPGLDVPSIWAPDAQGAYIQQRKYPNIPDNAQKALITVLEPILGDTGGRVPLLGASYDRFDDYADVEDDAIVGGATPAEKFLTLPLVLDRLNRVAGALTPMALWQQATVNAQLGTHSAQLMLPSGVDGYRFHAELLRDVVNPRGGHSVAADTYAQAIKKAIALRKADTVGNTTQGSKRSYYFYSTRSHRGLSVVITNDAYVLTVYYAGNATHWWTTALTPEVRLERTVA